MDTDRVAASLPPVADGAPGFVAVLAQDDEVMFEVARGRADVRAPESLRIDGRFDVASLSKQFTAACLAWLDLDGDLGLDDRLRRWLPELSVEFDAVTVRQLIHHQGGLPDYLDVDNGWGIDIAAPCSHAQAYELVATHARPTSAPGTAFAYSNSGYVVLASIVEAVAGQAFTEVLVERIFDPLGMAATGNVSHDRVGVAAPVVGHIQRPADGSADGGPAFEPCDASCTVNGDGGVLTTAPDLLRWDEAVAVEGLLPQHVREILLTPGALVDGTPTAYAGGLMLTRYGHTTRRHHGGGVPGFRSELTRLQDPAITVVVLANRSDLDAPEIARSLTAVAAEMDVQWPDEHPPGALGLPTSAS